MIIKTAEFKCSSQKLSQCPDLNDMREFAFIGRSNVGKSSLINMLTNNQGLAKVSSMPGKTRLINHFIINDQWALVDLPGYGYAKSSKKDRSEFHDIITSYVKNREQMFLLFVLIDSRLEPQKIDLNFIEMLGEEGIPFSIIFTKSDKVSASQLSKNVKTFKNKLSEQWEELPDMLISSSEHKIGRDDILDYIEKMISI